MRKALCGLAMALCMAAAPVSAQEPGGGDMQVPYTEFDLPNGLHVILHEDHTIPMVYTNIWY